MKTTTQNPESELENIPEQVSTGRPTAPLTREQITRLYAFFGTVIPASSADAIRRHTAYFYMREAIESGHVARRRANARHLQTAGTRP